MKKVIHSSKIYFHKWKIKIIESKTDAIIYPFNKSPKRDPTIELSLDNTILPIKPVVKYMGIMLDSKLLFKQHMAMICDKETGNQYLIIRIKFCYIRLVFALSLSMVAKYSGSVLNHT